MNEHDYELLLSRIADGSATDDRPRPRAEDPATTDNHGTGRRTGRAWLDPRLAAVGGATNRRKPMTRTAQVLQEDS